MAWPDGQEPRMRKIERVGMRKSGIDAGSGKIFILHVNVRQKNIHHRLCIKQPDRQWLGHLTLASFCHLPQQAHDVGTTGSWWGSHGGGVESMHAPNSPGSFPLTKAFLVTATAECPTCLQQSPTPIPNMLLSLEETPTVHLVVSRLQWNPFSLELSVIHFHKNRHMFWVYIYLSWLR